MNAPSIPPAQRSPFGRDSASSGWLVERSLLLPLPPRPVLRGIGLLASLITALYVGVVNALLDSTLRASPMELCVIVLHCVAALSLLSLGAGVSAVTLGRSQRIARAVTSNTLLASWMVTWLSDQSDLDHDGYGRYFDGNDCNDRDPRINPGARDLPGNGVDENCSGLDARPLHERGDGGFVAETGIPAGVRPSFLLIVIDTMRPDHMSAYGYHRPTTRSCASGARTPRRCTRGSSRRSPPMGSSARSERPCSRRRSSCCGTCATAPGSCTT